MNKIFFKKNKKDKDFSTKIRYRSGFTLIEMLVAVMIFSTSILALMSILGKGISDTTYAKNKTIASYLAVEGIEYMRNFRDTYILYGAASPASGWNSFLVKINNCKITVSPTGCNFNDSLTSFAPSGSLTFKQCDLGLKNCSLFYDSFTGKYFYNDNGNLGGVDSGFTRTISFSSTLVNPDEIKVSSTVSWSRGSIPYSVTFSDNLLQWKEQ